MLLTIVPGGRGDLPVPSQPPGRPPIPSVTVPLALMGTLALMYPLGFSLDNLSLMGLSHRGRLRGR